MLLSQIIADADALVPNGYASEVKVPWLNALNQEFFDVVKIPLTHSFSSLADQAEYTLPAGVKGKNIDRVQIGTVPYQSMQYDNIMMGRAYWIFDDDTLKLTVHTAPKSIQQGVVRYYKSAATSFSSDNLAVEPDAPSEYHWIYVLGLAEYIAKAEDGEDAKAANYGAQYRNALNVAAQNYRKVVGS